MGKLGIFGGTFNPIHNAHIRIAEEAGEHFRLDRVILMPSGYSYMKDAREIAPKEDRLYMTRLAVADKPYFEVSTIELEQEGPTYTYETMQKLHLLYPEDRLCFIIGADQLFILDKWRKPEELFRLVQILAADRGGFDTGEMEAKAEELRQRYGAEIFLYHPEASELSSSELRRRIREGESIRDSVPEPVAAYIEEKGLYR